MMANRQTRQDTHPRDPPTQRTHEGHDFSCPKVPHPLDLYNVICMTLMTVLVIQNTMHAMTRVMQGDSALDI